MNLEPIAKKVGLSNPLITHKFGADPYALVYNDRLYIYMTNDNYAYDENGNIIVNDYLNINKISVISSEDLVNWTDHGEIAVAGQDGAAKWANHSWAPAVVHKVINGLDKFFLYFANDASNIGVLTSDSPVGPFIDPLGKSLINRDIKGVEGVVWCFDPAVLVDDDNNAYLYFGGGLPSLTNSEDILHPKSGRVIQLGDDMISTIGEAVLIDAPALFEDSGIHKYNGRYYYSYCSNFAGEHPDGYPPHGEIAYMVSENPMGPFTYIGSILKNPAYFFGDGGNNHHAIFEFKGKWYITYHTQTVGRSLNNVMGYRSTHINEIEISENGIISDIKADMNGVSSVGTINPFEGVEAETFAWSAGINTTPDSNLNMVVTDINNGDFISVSNVDFKDGATRFYATIQSINGGEIDIRIDSTTGDIIGNLIVNGKNTEWSVISTNVNNISGIHNVFFMFKGKDDIELFNFDCWRFEN